MNEDDKEQVATRLKRIAGQLSGIQRMVEEERYCIDIVAQVDAVRSGLVKISKQLLAGHLKTCVSDSFEKGDARERREKIAELLEVFERASGG